MSDTLPPPPADLLIGASLFLDFDGTLVEIAATPDAVRVSDALRQLLRDLDARLAGRVAIVSGRSVSEIAALIDPVRLPIAGSHGLEIAAAGAPPIVPTRTAGVDAALSALRDFAADRPGVLVEDKPFGVGLHYRQAPAAEDEARALAGRLADEHDLHLQLGKMVAELRLPGADKGSALNAMMAEPARASTRPVFMGDDVTDEAAFAAACDLGGAGILIGPARDTAARFRLDDVSAALDWLRAGAEVLA
ncbi:trehalose-phosphatase [Sphingomonas sp. RHCKR47]|uniref:trehalose-phosphatase n=1 Tax=Sphingomonas citricola TaxID=2862498 RepID=UPI001CA49306|nr:trehalose-phosphatase [Sphingomonas citricola]MBW6524703.1 trehalose-phosphatase [Sphingomonas citricola]